MLYPLKFKPILKSRIWGGDALIKAGKKRPKDLPADAGIGESWEISGMEHDMSVVANGFLKSNTIEEIIEVYMGDLVGDEIYDKYGLQFPLLVKFIDARDVLSVQVHPDDRLALERHEGRGKTEMWYVIDHEPGACIYVGFKRKVTREEYLKAVDEGNIADLLMRYEVKKGDVFYIPSGTVHAIGAGIVLAEIQQTSDITYRIFDWNRVDADGRPRPLHTREAVDAIDFSGGGEYRQNVVPQPGKVLGLVSTPYFNTNLMGVSEKMSRDYGLVDTFVIYVCVGGECVVSCRNGSETLSTFETMLIPADIDEVELSGNAVILEVFID